MENLQPAISNIDILKEISSQDFQEMLSTWFEEKGIISELKSHAKYQMMNVLKNTPLGKKLCKTPSQTFTLTQQALHLIVAEYLLQNQCHYSFSLFSSEVSLSKLFPESRLHFNGSENHGDQPAKVFDKENLTNILELIGIPKRSEECKKLMQTYFKNENKSSIFTCLIDLVNQKNKEDTCQDEIEIDLEDDFLHKVSHILLSSNITQKTYVKVIQEIKQCYEQKAKSFEDQCLKLITKFREELSLRNHKLHSCNKKKKKLERQLIRTTQEQKVLKHKVSLYGIDMEDNETPGEDCKISCGLEHCSETCRTTKETCQNYQKENERLTDKTNFQTSEITKIKKKYEYLKQDLMNCQSKINLLKLKLQDQSTNNSYFVPEVNVPVKSKNSSESSEQSPNNLTEEVLREARNKLKQLEEESEEIDMKYKSFVIK